MFSIDGMLSMPSHEAYALIVSVSSSRAGRNVNKSAMNRPFSISIVIRFGRNKMEKEPPRTFAEPAYMIGGT